MSDPLESDLEGRVAVLGIGNELRGDDAAGLRVAEKLQQELESSSVLIVPAGSVPENFSLDVKDFGPDHIILIDSVDLGNDPGSVFKIDPSDISNPSLSTHSISLEKIIGYWKDNTNANIIFLGIQPKRLGFDSGFSEEVENSVEKIFEYLLKCLG